MKRYVVLFAALAAVAIPFVGGTCATAAGQKNIVQLAASSPQLSTLVTLVKKAGLVSALSGKTKLTVFAPTNAAFAALPKATVAALEKNPKALAKVLEYHVLPGVYPAAKVLKTKSAKTLEGGTVTFHVSGGSAYINSSKIIATNLFASNGVVHLINKVLTPKA